MFLPSICTNMGSHRASEKIENCPAGVVVNQGITQPTTKDFYLLSHAAIIGSKSAFLGTIYDL
jgi:eukaryotic translation initiation factor 2C